MERFNPITDLQPTDSVSVPTADISDEIESLRLRLIQTKKETNNVVNIIKDKNNSLNSDLKKIKNLNRRLNITIPRIPSMPGKAGVQFGEEVEQEKRRKRLGIRLPPRLPLIRFPSKVPSTAPKFKRAKLQKVVSTIKKPIDIYSYARGAKTGINLAKSKTLRKQIAKVYKKSQPLELPAKPIRPLKKTVSKGKGASTGGNVFTKTVNRVKKFLSPKKNEVPLNTAERMRIADLTRKNSSRLTERSQKIKLFKKNFQKPISQSDEFFYNDYLKAAKLTHPKKLKIQLNEALKSENAKLVQLRDSGKINEKVFNQRSSEIFKRYSDDVQRIDRYALETTQQFEKILKFFKIKPRGRMSKKRSNVLDQLSTKQEKIKKRYPEAQGFKEKQDPLYKGDMKMNEDGTFEYIKTPLKDPNLLSLNTDTSVTNTVIILTDPPIA